MSDFISERLEPVGRTLDAPDRLPRRDPAKPGSERKPPKPPRQAVTLPVEAPEDSDHELDTLA